MDNKQLTDEQKKAARKKRADEFWGMFLPVKNGKVKSTVLLYSVCLSFLFVAVHVLSFLLLIDYLDAAFAPLKAVWLINLLESLIPAVISVALCCAVFFAVKQKQLVFGAYVCVAVYALVILVATLAQAQSDVRPVLWHLFALAVPLPVLLGLGVSLAMLLAYRKKHPPEPEVQPRKAWE